MVWTGEEMIVWGGCKEETCRTRYADGAAYNPASNEWRLIAESPLSGRNYHLAAWTGSEMLILGGWQSNRTAAAYSPSTDTWRLMPEPPFAVSMRRLDGVVRTDLVTGVWTGHGYIVWDAAQDRLAEYSPTGESWSLLPSTGLEVDLGVLRWTGNDLYALGSLNSAVYPDRVPLLGALLVDDGWESLPPGEFWGERVNAEAEARLATWVGDRLVAFTDGGFEYGRTATYRPGATAWEDIDPVPLPATDYWPEPLVIGQRLLVFHHVGGAIYEPATGAWIPVTIPFGEAGRAVWTGEEVIFWGGTCCYGTAGRRPFEVAVWRYTPPPE